MPLLFNVPQKEHMKLLGKTTSWEPDIGKWIVKNTCYYCNFIPYISSDDSFSIICDHFYIVEGTQICCQCHKSTPVIGIGIEDYYSVKLNEKSSTETKKEYLFQSSLDTKRIYIINPAPLLQEPVIKPIYNYIQKHWNYDAGNRCKKCGTQLDEEYLFSDVESPFFVFDKKAAAELTLHKVSLKYDLVVKRFETGYSPADIFIQEEGKIVDTDIMLNPLTLQTAL